jgi:hypothetical protein
MTNAGTGPTGTLVSNSVNGNVGYARRIGPTGLPGGGAQYIVKYSEDMMVFDWKTYSSYAPFQLAEGTYYITAKSATPWNSAGAAYTPSTWYNSFLVLSQFNPSTTTYTDIAYGLLTDPGFGTSVLQHYLAITTTTQYAIRLYISSQSGGSLNVGSTTYSSLSLAVDTSIIKLM